MNGQSNRNLRTNFSTYNDKFSRTLQKAQNSNSPKREKITESTNIHAQSNIDLKSYNYLSNTLKIPHKRRVSSKKQFSASGAREQNATLTQRYSNNRALKQVKHNKYQNILN